jgi:anti-sigma factor RsiW
MNARGRHPGDRLAALVDGRLGEPDRSRVIAHLTQCPDCLADYDAQLSLKGMLGGLGAPAAPEALRGRLSELLAETPRDPEPPTHRVGMPAKVGAAVVVLAIATLGGGYVAGGAPEGQAVVPPVDQYVREHAAVSVGVPLTAPVLYQLVPAPSSLVVTPVVVPAVSSTPAPAPAHRATAVEPGPARPATGVRSVVLRHGVPVTAALSVAVRR